MSDDTLAVFTAFGMGDGDPELRLKLAATWLRVCLENDRLPGAIAFYTEGVKLACEGSPVLDELTKMEERGVRLILCKTCLDRYGLDGRVLAGVVGGMGDIFAAQSLAAKVVRL